MTVTRSQLRDLLLDVEIRISWLGLLLSKKAQLGNALIGSVEWHERIKGRIAYLFARFHEPENALALVQTVALVGCIQECQCFLSLQRDLKGQPNLVLRLLYETLQEMEDCEGKTLRLRQLGSFNPLDTNARKIKQMLAHQDQVLFDAGISRAEIEILRSHFRFPRTRKDRGRIALQRAQRARKTKVVLGRNTFMFPEMSKMIQMFGSVRDSDGGISVARLRSLFSSENQTTS